MLYFAPPPNRSENQTFALRMLSSFAHERERAIAEKCDYIELSTSAEFNTFYVEEMEFTE